ncbi:MAG: hypothetical protein P8Y29_10285 [Gemmatimonadota bacterium]
MPRPEPGQGPDITRDAIDGDSVDQAVHADVTIGECRWQFLCADRARR